MPGIPQGRDVGEHGPKSVTLASVLDDGSVTMEERIVSLAQFERVAVDASGVASWSDLAARLEKALGEAAGRSASDHLVARLAVSGATSMAWNIRRDADLLRTEAEARAEAIGNVWIEKIDIDCRRPVVGSAESADPIEALRRTMSDEIVGSEAFRAEADGIVNDLLAQLPPECRTTPASTCSSGDSPAKDRKRCWRDLPPAARRRHVDAHSKARTSTLRQVDRKS